MIAPVSELQSMKFLMLLSLFLVPFTSHAHATLFNLPRFVTPGEFAIGFEPELTLTSGAGLAGNLKYTQGLNDLTNFQAVLGTGGGPKRFRVGGSMTFDFFPDIDGQPGIGLGVGTIYYRLPTQGRLEMTAMPYLHKTFATSGGDVEPFFSVPFGMAFTSGRYQAISSLVVGSMFKNSEHIRYSIELGIAINNTDSYVSGGLTYYH
jgi:hypothetical protein